MNASGSFEDEILQCRPFNLILSSTKQHKSRDSYVTVMWRSDRQ